MELLLEFYVRFLSHFVRNGKISGHEETYVDAFVRVVHGAESRLLIVGVVPFIRCATLGKRIFPKTVPLTVVIGAFICIAIRIPGNARPYRITRLEGSTPCEFLQTRISESQISSSHLKNSFRKSDHTVFDSMKKSWLKKIHCKKLGMNWMNLYLVSLLALFVFLVLFTRHLSNFNVLTICSSSGCGALWTVID